MTEWSGESCRVSNTEPQSVPEEEFEYHPNDEQDGDSSAPDRPNPMAADQDAPEL